jgi:predicted Zn-ribbon and HTH transcriptional regulator
MKIPYYRCEDCGFEFEKSDLIPEIEDSPLACPACDGLDIELVAGPEPSAPSAGREAA